MKSEQLKRLNADCKAVYGYAPNQEYVRPLAMTYGIIISSDKSRRIGFGGRVFVGAKGAEAIGLIWTPRWGLGNVLGYAFQGRAARVASPRRDY